MQNVDIEYKDLAHTLKCLKIQVKDSMPEIDKYIPSDIKNPEELFYYLRDITVYKKDPKGVELLQMVQTLMKRGGKGDCDCFTILTLAACEYLGFTPLYVAIVGNSKSAPSHIYTEVFDKKKKGLCVFDLTNPYYCMERPYNYKQLLKFDLNMRLQLEDGGGMSSCRVLSDPNTGEQFTLSSRASRRARRAERRAARAERKSQRRAAKKERQHMRQEKKLLRVKKKKARQEMKVKVREAKTAKKLRRINRRYQDDQQAPAPDTMQPDTMQPDDMAPQDQQTPDMPQDNTPDNPIYPDEQSNDTLSPDFMYPGDQDAGAEEIPEEEGEEVEMNDYYNNLTLNEPLVVWAAKKAGGLVKSAKNNPNLKNAVAKNNKAAQQAANKLTTPDAPEDTKVSPIIIGGVALAVGFGIAKLIK